MFTFTASPFAIPGAVSAMCRNTWDDLAAPGSNWSGPARLAIAAQARAARLGTDHVDDTLAGPVQEKVRLLAAVPAVTTREWVADAVSAVGEPAYVELVGIVARVIAIDTLCRLVGVDPEPFPVAVTGQPAAVPPRGMPRRGKAWVAMTGIPVPPNVLSLVPPAMEATNATAEALYMTGAQMDDPDTTIDGLHRTQIEIVATSVSHSNECFY